MHQKIRKWFQFAYHQLVEINDTPHRKALGLGLGVFLGIFPGVGPIASLIGAYILRVNRAAALLGSLLTNTWFTIVTFALALKIGAWLSHGDKEKMQLAWQDLWKDFHWGKLNDEYIVRIFLAILAGFALISFSIGLIVYIVTFYFLNRHQALKKGKL